MTTPQAEWELITDEAGFLALEAEWEALWLRTASRRWTRSFGFLRTGWLTTGRPRGRGLYVLVMREGGQAVLIWPLTLRKRGWCTELQPLGCEATEYLPLLVEGSPEAERRIAAAFTYLHQAHAGDLLSAPLVRSDFAAHPVLTDQTLPCHSETSPSPFIDWEGFADCDAYWKARSKNTRERVGRRSRRFAEQGEVSFYLVEDGAEYLELLDWTLKAKSDWMGRKGLDNDFLRTPEFHTFLADLWAAPGSTGKWVMFVLRLDGKVIATTVGSLDAMRYEGFIGTNNSDYETYSPGSIILVKTLQWLMERGLEYDFRIGTEPYKRDWATHDCPTTSFRFALTLRGRAYLAAGTGWEKFRILKDRLRTAIPQETRRKVKARLRALLGRAG